MIAVEPTDEQLFRGLVPAAGVPQRIQSVGRMLERRDDRSQRRRSVGHRVRSRPFRISPAGQFEQVDALGAR
jgi:hypothetical protein